MSDFSVITDYIVADLIDNVPELTDAIVHKYAPWSAESMSSMAGERHLAVWPAGASETTAWLTSTAHELTQNYLVACWEDSSATGTRRMDDDTANLAWLDLENAVRARFYKTANEFAGGTLTVEIMTYEGVVFGADATRVRSFVVAVEARVIASFS